MRTMTALRAHRRGGPEMLVVDQAPVPEVGPGDVLVVVHAVAITFAELTWDETWRHLPAIPGHEVSGVVAQVGAEVDRFRAGDEVLGLVPFDRNGAAAELACLPAKNAGIKPPTLSHVAAAAVPLAALTAWQALVDHARVRRGESVLVHGGAGGVGSFAVQLASCLGASVTATVRGADVGFALALGAERALDVATGAFDKQGQVYDVVIDTVGGETLDRSYRVLRPGGRLVTLQAPPSARRAAEAGVEASFFVVGPDSEALTRLTSMVAAGELEVHVAATFPLEQGRAAFQSGGRRDRAPGKTIIVVRSDAAAVPGLG